jgi:hypothetical protein
MRIFARDCECAGLKSNYSSKSLLFAIYRQINGFEHLILQPVIIRRNRAWIAHFHSLFAVRTGRIVGKNMRVIHSSLRPTPLRGSLFHIVLEQTLAGWAEGVALHDRDFPSD